MIRRSIIIAVIIIFTVYIFPKALSFYSIYNEVSPSITYEEKIKNIAYDEVYGEMILEEHNIKYELDGFFGGPEVIETENIVISPGEDIYIETKNTTEFIVLYLTDNEFSVEMHSTEAYEKKIFNLLEENNDLIIEKKNIVDQYYNEYIESKYGCTYGVDCSVWHNFS